MRPTVTLLVVLLVSVSAHAQRSLLIPFQGVLTDTSGIPVNGSVTIHLKLYHQSEGGLPVWSESQTVELSSGIFNVYLGQETAFSQELFKNQLWLGIAIDTDEEMVPRTLLATSPYSAALFSSVDYDASILDSPELIEPPAIGSIYGSLAPVDVFDFLIDDGGGGDMLPTMVSEIVIRISGKADAADASFWINGPDASSVVGIVAGVSGNQTVTFGPLAVSVDDDDFEVYTISMQVDPTPANTIDGDYFILSVDEQDLVTSGGTRFMDRPTVDNGKLDYSVEATQLVVTTQPNNPETRTVPFDFVVAYEDANGNTDWDISGDVVTLNVSDFSVSILQPLGGQVTAVSGVASFTAAAQVALQAPSAKTGIMLIAHDDPGGAIDLSAAPVNSTSFDLD